MRSPAVLAFLLFAGAPAFAREAPREAVLAHEVASRLAALGPRSAEEVRARAAALLAEELRRAGLEQVRAVRRGDLINVEGLLPGKVPEEIVLSAHYDSVAWSPGAGDDASGCGVAAAAAAELRRTPLRHTVRVVLFDDEETGLRGSRRWLADLGPEGRRRILAALNLEMLGWSGSAGPVILGFPARTSDGGVALAPGWLVHAVLRSGEAVGFSYAVADNRAPLPGQFVMRASHVLYGSDAEPFLAQGVPSVTLSDSSLLVQDPAYHGQADAAARLDARRLDLWTHAVAAAVRRLDALAGRPVWEDRYLVVFGRVWLRRDLIWIGFLLWVFLVFRGRPGRRRGGPAGEPGRRMWGDSPALLFRVLLLLAVFLATVFSVLLLAAAALALAPPRAAWARILWIVLGVLPLLCFLAVLGVAFGLEIAVADLASIGPAAAVLLPAVLLSYAWTIGRGPRRQPRLTEETFSR